MKKRQSYSLSTITDSFESSLNQITKIYKKSKPNKTQKDFSKTLVISPAVSKMAFVVLMVFIFVALSFNSNSITSYSVLNTVNYGANFGIFFALLGLVFFLTYERRKLKK